MSASLRAACYAISRPHFGAWSGYPRLLSYLSDAGASPAISLVSDSDDDFPTWGLLANSALRRAIRRVALPRAMPWYKLSDLHAELRAMRPWRARADVVHFLDGEHTPRLVPWLRKRTGFGAPTIATFHQPPAVLERVVRRDIVARLDSVILLSQSQRAFFDGVLPAACINVIPHGVDVARFIPAPRAASDNRQFRCLVTGSYLRDWRIVRALPRLLSDMPAIAFDVVSASPDIESCSRITVHRTISDDALLALYRRAHLLVLPLTDAAANNALVEGMACGLPCVATDLPSIGEYAGDAAQLVPHHADAFAHAIRQLAADPVTRAVMGNAARRRAERLAWPLVALQHVDVYRHVLRRH